MIGVGLNPGGNGAELLLHLRLRLGRCRIAGLVGERRGAKQHKPNNNDDVLQHETSSLDPLPFKSQSKEILIKLQEPGGVIVPCQSTTVILFLKP